MPITNDQYQEMLARTERRCAKAKPIREIDDAVEKESELQQQIRGFLRDKRWPFVWSPMYLRTSTGIGTVDFIVAAPKGRTLWVEAKSKTGKLKPEQIGFQMLLEANGHEHYVVRSYREFLEAINDTHDQHQNTPQFTSDAGINSGREP